MGMSIISFENDETEDVFNGVDTRRTRKLLPPELLRVVIRKLDMLNSVTRLDDLRHPPGNRLEALHGDRKGQHSIRINDQYRVCFKWTASGPAEVEIVDYH